MRIIQWVRLYRPEIGGLEFVVQDIIRSLRGPEFEFIVVASHGPTPVPDLHQFEGVDVYRFHYLTALQSGDLQQIIRVRRQIAALKKEFRPDIVHVHFSDPSFYFHMHTLKSHPCQTIVTLHNSLSYIGSAGDDTLVHQMLKTADWVTGVSAKTLQDAVAYVPEIETRSSVIYNGLSPTGIEIKPPTFEEPRMLCIGRLEFQKGFEIAIDAAAVMSEQLSDLKLTIAGDGTERAALQDRVAGLGLDNRVEFVGAVSHDQVMDLLNDCNLVLMPSRFEGFPLVALEAAQAERPIVATNVDGLAEAVLHDETGLLIEPENAKAMANAASMLFRNEDKARQLAKSARMRFEQEFTLTRCFESYKKLYRFIDNQSVT